MAILGRINQITDILVKFTTSDNEKDKEYNITYTLNKKSHHDIGFLLLNEIFNIMLMDDKIKISSPKEIIITVTTDIKANDIYYTPARKVTKQIVKSFSKIFINDTVVLKEMMDFLFNLEWYIQELENHINIKEKHVYFIDNINKN